MVLAFNLNSLMKRLVLPEGWAPKRTDDMNVKGICMNNMVGTSCYSDTLLEPDWIAIVVSGDPGRNQSKMYVQNQTQGVPVSKLVALPANWRRSPARG